MHAYIHTYIHSFTRREERSRDAGSYLSRQLCWLHTQYQVPLPLKRIPGAVYPTNLSNMMHDTPMTQHIQESAGPSWRDRPMVMEPSLRPKNVKLPRRACTMSWLGTEAVIIIQHPKDLCIATR